MTTALVTGATAGIGREFARQLAERGSDLVLVARDVERLETVAAELRERHGIEVEILAADLSDRAGLQRVADRLADHDHPVDLLVNNAGFGLKRRTIDNDIADEERMFDVLCRAVLVLSHAAATAMRPRRAGTIINVSSVAGFASMGSYSAAKAWVTAFSEGLDAEVGRYGVQVTALCPGFTRTEFHQRAELRMSQVPSALWLTTEDVVRQGLRDASEGKSLSVPGWQYKAMVVGIRLVPRSLPRRLARRG